MTSMISGSWAYETAKGHVVLDQLRRHGGLAGKRILEIGPSTGALLRLLDENGAEADSIDVNSEWSHNYSYAPEKRRILDLEHQELPADMVQRYEIIIAQEVIEHIRRPYDFIGRLKAALKPGGVLFLTTPNLVGITAWLKGEKWCGLTTPTHYILYSPRSLTFMLENLGFAPMDVFANLVPIARASRNPFLSGINRAAGHLKIGGGLMGFYTLKQTRNPEQKTGPADGRV